MAQQNEAQNRNYSATNLVFLLSASLMIVGLFASYHQFPQNFKFNYNPYALLTAIEVSVCLYLLTALYFKKGNFYARMWCGIAIAGSLFLGIGELLQRLSITAEQALFWSNLGMLGLVAIPIGFYMFVHFFCETRSNPQDAFIPVILITSGGLLLGLTLNGERISLLTRDHGAWGYSQPIGTAFIIMMLWLTAVVSTGLYKLFIYAVSQKGHGESKKGLQTNIVAIGTLVGLVGGMLLDVAPHYLGYNILPVGVLLQSIMPIGLLYAMSHYNTLGVDFSLVADDILDTVDEGIVITDTNFLIKKINRFTAEMSGYSDTELYAKHISQLFDPAVYGELIVSITEELKTAKIAHIGDSSMNTKSGGVIAVSISVSKLSAEVPSYMFAINDISQFKRYYQLEQDRNHELESSNNAFKEQQKAMLNLLEDSRELSEQLANEKEGVELTVAERTAELGAERTRLEASINSLNVGFMILNSDKKIFTANAAFRDIIGQPKRSKKLDLGLLIDPLEAVFDLKKAVDECLSKGVKKTWDNLQFGEKIIRIFMAPIIESSDAKQTLGAVVLVEDITEAKAIERSRDEFFSIASHELRTPLTAIRGNTQMMIEYYKKELKDPSLQEMVGDIHDSSIRLITIVNDFLDTSRLEQGKISFKMTDFDIQDLVADVKQEFGAGEVNPDLYLKVTAQPKIKQVYADRDRLKQCIINLVGNAYKFTEKGGVSIDLTLKNDTVMIAVTDTGKGIPAESRNLLFRKFQQASNNILTRDSTRSTGLGLYISKLIMEGMNGKIYMDISEVGKGSTFVIEIPASKKDAKNDIIEPTPNKALKKGLS